MLRGNLKLSLSVSAQTRLLIFIIITVRFTGNCIPSPVHFVARTELPIYRDKFWKASRFERSFLNSFCDIVRLWSSSGNLMKLAITFRNRSRPFCLDASRRRFFVEMSSNISWSSCSPIFDDTLLCNSPNCRGNGRTSNKARAKSRQRQNCVYFFERAGIWQFCTSWNYKKKEKRRKEFSWKIGKHPRDVLLYCTVVVHSTLAPEILSAWASMARESSLSFRAFVSNLSLVLHVTELLTKSSVATTPPNPREYVVFLYIFQKRAGAWFSFFFVRNVQNVSVLRSDTRWRTLLLLTGYVICLFIGSLSISRSLDT